MRNATLSLTIACALSACSQWPQLDAPPQSESDTWPALLPLEDLGTLSAPQGDAQTEAQRLSARAAGLRARAQIMRRAIPDQDAFEAMRARLAR